MRNYDGQGKTKEEDAADSARALGYTILYAIALIVVGLMLLAWWLA